MLRKTLAALAATAIFATSFAPVEADARERRGYYDRDYRHDGYRRRGHRDRDNGDAVAAVVVGLVLGLAIGSLASQPRDRGPVCRDNYQRCAPPPGQYDRRDSGYYEPRYDDRGSAYERDYGLEGGRYEDSYYDDQPRICTIQQRRWDDRAGRYVIVDMPARC
jgi:hypothetical protein